MKKIISFIAGLGLLLTSCGTSNQYPVSNVTNSILPTQTNANQNKQIGKINSQKGNGSKVNTITKAS